MRRLFYVLFAIVTITIVGALIVIHTNWGRNQIRRVVEAELHAAFPGGAKIGALEGSLVSDFTLRDIEIDAMDGKPAIKVGRVTTNVALLELFNKTAKLEYLELEDVDIALGGAPLKPASEASAEPSEPTAWSVSLQEISLEKGSFAVLGEQPQHIDRLDLTGGVEIPAGRRITAHVLATAHWRERDAPILIDASTAVGDTTIIRNGKINVGKVVFEATRVALDPAHPTGKIEITGTAEAIAELAPAIKLPADAKLTLEAKPAGAVLQVAIDGTVGDANIHGSVRGDIASKSISGYVGAGVLDIGPFLPASANAPDHTRGEVAIALTANTAGARGIVGVHGAALDVPSGDLTLVLDTTWKELSATVLGAGAGNTKIAATAHGTRDGNTITIDRGRVVTSTTDLGAPSAKRIEIAGTLDLDAKLTKPAVLGAKTDLEFSGTARGQRVATGDVYVGNLTSSFSGRLRDKLAAHAHVEARNASKGGKPLGYATADADLEDGRISMTIDAHPAMAAVRVVASAVIDPGPVTTITLRDHTITPAVGAPWVGKGGTITIADTVTVKDFETGNGAGKAKVDAQVAGSTIDAKVDATALPVSAIDPKLVGSISGTLGIKRRAGRWDGGGDLVLAGLIVDPKQPAPLDGTAKLKLAGRTITLDTKAKAEGIGAVRFELEVEGPRDVTDPAAWARLERTAITNATITADNIELAKLSPTGGLVDGKIVLGATTTEGTVDIKGIETPVGIAEGTVTFSPQGQEIYASWKALLSEVGEGNIGVRLAIPQHPFDPKEWSQLGATAMRELTATFDDLVLDPAKLEKLGVRAPYTARADLKLLVGAAASSANLIADLRSIEGGVLAKPVDLHVLAVTDVTGTTASACAARSKDPKGDACATRGLGASTTAKKLLELTDVKTPVTMAMWTTDPKAALGSSLSGKLSVPEQAAPEYLALFGRSDFDPSKGVVRGTVAIDGTLGKPTATATFELEKLQLLTDLVGRAIPELTIAKLEGKWDGAGGYVELTTRDSNGGTLHARVDGKPTAWQDAKAGLEASSLDLAPLAALLPGELRSSQGLLIANVKVNGFDLATTKMDGTLRIKGLQVPIHPIAGTLKEADVNLTLADTGIVLKAKGLLNSCRNPDNPKCVEKPGEPPANVWLDATAPTDLTRIEGTFYADKISTIGEIEPIIDGRVKINLRRVGGQLVGDIAQVNCQKGEDRRCRDGRIVVPVSTGDDLLDFEAPDDLYFIENAPKQLRFGEARAPTKAWLDVKVAMDSTRIDVEEYRVKGSIVTREPLRLQVGDEIGLDGKISVEYGSADDIFGRQYEIEPNDLVSFDGTIDPTVDLRMSHQFSELNLTVKVQGRLSDPDFPHATFSADRGSHSESELFGYFLGGEPGGSTANQAQDAALGAGASVLSQKLTKTLKNVLPERLKRAKFIGRVLDPNVLKCEPGTTTAGTSCTVGYRFLDDRLYISLKRRQVLFTNENATEVDGQYNLSQEWFLEGSGGNAQVYGADLLWHRRW